MTCERTTAIGRRIGHLEGPPARKSRRHPHARELSCMTDLRKISLLFQCSFSPAQELNQRNQFRLFTVAHACQYRSIQLTSGLRPLGWRQELFNGLRRRFRRCMKGEKRHCTFKFRQKLRRLLSSRSKLLLRKFECFHDAIFSDVFDQTLLLKEEIQMWISVQDLENS